MTPIEQEKLVRETIEREIDRIAQGSGFGAIRSVDDIRKVVQYEVDLRDLPYEALVWLDPDDAGTVHVGFRSRIIVVTVDLESSQTLKDSA